MRDCSEICEAKEVSFINCFLTFAAAVALIFCGASLHKLATLPQQKMIDSQFEMNVAARVMYEQQAENIRRTMLPVVYVDGQERVKIETFAGPEVYTPAGEAPEELPPACGAGCGCPKDDCSCAKGTCEQPCCKPTPCECSAEPEPKPKPETVVRQAPASVKACRPCRPRWRNRCR